MRILVINPNTTSSMTREILLSARRCAAADTEITAVTAPWGPRSIEGHFEEVLAAAATVEVVAENRHDYDGFVIACYGDPGLYAAREVADVPVVGIGEASMHVASLLAHRFSVVTVIPRILPMLQDMVARYGFSERCASVRSSSLSVLEIEADGERARDAIVAQARAAIDQDGAEAITLGCAGMGTVERQVADALSGVPVIDGVTAAVALVESLVRMGLRTSPVKAFAPPEHKEIVGVAGALQDVASPGPLARPVPVS